MAQSVVIARERFLAEASTYLDSRCRSLANECRYQASVLNKVPSKEPNLIKLQCAACGSLDVHEQVVDVVGKSRKANGCKLQLLKCQSCSRTTKKRLQAKPLEKSKGDIKPKNDDFSAISSKAPEAQITTGKTSSKKRAKERKNQGLLAMLEKSKEPAQKSTSFGLLDFMSKQG